jgi:hypothetical protein
MVLEAKCGNTGNRGHHTEVLKVDCFK